MAVIVGKKPAAKVAKKKALAFTIDCTKPVEDKIMEIASFEKFLQDKIKLNGKTGVLGDAIKVVREKSKISVTSEVRQAGRGPQARRALAAALRRPEAPGAGPGAQGRGSGLHRTPRGAHHHPRPHAAGEGGVRRGGSLEQIRFCHRSTLRAPARDRRVVGIRGGASTGAAP
jgi:hypothetical protein